MKKSIFAVITATVLLASCSKEDSRDTTISGTLTFKNASGVIQIGSQFQNSVYEKNCEVIISGQNLSGNMLVIEHVTYQFPQYFGRLDYLFVKGDTVLDSIMVKVRNSAPVSSGTIDTTPQRDTVLYAKKFVATEIIPIEAVRSPNFVSSGTGSSGGASTTYDVPTFNLGVHKLMHIRKAYVMNSREKIEIPFVFK